MPRANRSVVHNSTVIVGEESSGMDHSARKHAVIEIPPCPLSRLLEQLETHTTTVALTGGGRLDVVHRGMRCLASLNITLEG